ncbi:MAG: hypothetical protein KDC33_09660 [Thermoleophilia bacterium]|nr:hypothetical protein [Thermoleophilia bacterium]
MSAATATMSALIAFAPTQASAIGVKKCGKVNNYRLQVETGGISCASAKTTVRAYLGRIKRGACPTAGICTLPVRGFMCSTASAGGKRAGTCLKATSMIVWYRR